MRNGGGVRVDGIVEIGVKGPPVGHADLQRIDRDGQGGTLAKGGDGNGGGSRSLSGQQPQRRNRDNRAAIAGIGGLAGRLEVNVGP